MSLNESASAFSPRRARHFTASNIVRENIAMGLSRKRSPVRDSLDGRKYKQKFRGCHLASWPPRDFRKYVILLLRTLR